MVRRIRGGGVAALAAALMFGAMAGPAHAEDTAKRDQKEQERIGGVAAERQLYVGKLALLDAKQIALGNLALEKTQDPKVRQFAQKLVDDHKQHMSELKSWADSKSIEVSTIDLSSPPPATGGSGESGGTGSMQKGYDKKMEGVDERLNKAITEAEKDLDKLRAKNGKEFDRGFLSRVAEDDKKGKDLVKQGMDKYSSDATFSVLLVKTRQGIETNERHAKELEKSIR